MAASAGQQVAVSLLAASRRTRRRPPGSQPASALPLGCLHWLLPHHAAQVLCGSKEGMYNHASKQVFCSCEECASKPGSGSGGGGQRDPRQRGTGGGGAGTWHSLSEFEKHGGKGGNKNSKRSILIKATGERGGRHGDGSSGVAFCSLALGHIAVRSACAEDTAELNCKILCTDYIMVAPFLTLGRPAPGSMDGGTGQRHSGRGGRPSQVCAL